MASFLIMLILILTISLPTEAMEIVKAEEILAQITGGAPVSYDSILIKGNLDLDNTLVIAPIQITNSEMDGYINFKKNIFNNSVNFNGTYFKGYTGFIGSIFLKDVLFQNAHFIDNAYFEYSKFGGIVSFSGSTFSDDAIFAGSNFSKEADFIGVEFNGDAKFSESDFNSFAYFYDAQFLKKAEFWYTNFMNYTGFSGSRFNDVANFDEATFNGNVDFRESFFSKNSDFIATWGNIKDHLACSDSTYQALIRAFKESGLFYEADECYYQRMHHLPARSPFDQAIKSLAWATCGYGVRPEYTICLSFLLIILFSIIYFIGGGIVWPKDLNMTKNSTKHLHRINFGDALYFSFLIFFVALPPPAWKVKGSWRYVIALEDITGWTLMTLFVVTLGNIMIR